MKPPSSMFNGFGAGLAAGFRAGAGLLGNPMSSNSKPSAFAGLAVFGPFLGFGPFPSLVFCGVLVDCFGLASVSSAFGSSPSFAVSVFLRRQGHQRRRLSLPMVEDLPSGLPFRSLVPFSCFSRLTACRTAFAAARRGPTQFAGLARLRVHPPAVRPSPDFALDPELRRPFPVPRALLPDAGPPDVSPDFDPPRRPEPSSDRSRPPRLARPPAPADCPPRPDPLASRPPLNQLPGFHREPVRARDPVWAPGPARPRPLDPVRPPPSPFPRPRPPSPKLRPSRPPGVLGPLGPDVHERVREVREPRRRCHHQANTEAMTPRAAAAATATRSHTETDQSTIAATMSSSGTAHHNSRDAGTPPCFLLSVLAGAASRACAGSSGRRSGRSLGTFTPSNRSSGTAGPSLD